MHIIHIILKGVSNKTKWKILALLFIAFIGCAEPVNEKHKESIQEKKTTAVVKLVNLDDQPVNLDQFKGKTVFVNFWATWCKPCIREMPSIDSARKLLGETDVVFFLASNETPDLINEFKKEHSSGLNYVRVLNLEELAIEALPTTYIFNPRGELVFSETGYRKWNDQGNIEMILQINNQK